VVPAAGGQSQAGVVKVVVFGATGKLGAQLLRQGLAAGHQITALVRDPSQLPPRPGLVALRGDVLDPSSVVASVAGQDAALWAVGGHDAVRSRLKRETGSRGCAARGPATSWPPWTATAFTGWWR
jgi:putative NADH-flavin reductase